MAQYIGLIHKERKSDYGVSFPDFPGAITAGKDLDDARRMAEEALALHIEGMIEDGESLPEPSSLDTIMKDKANKDGVAIVVDDALAPGAAEDRVGTAGEDDRIFDRDDALIVVAVQRPGLELSAGELAFVHQQMKRMVVMVALLARGL